MVRFIVGGGCDVMHPGHRQFFTELIEDAIANHSITDIHMYLKTDKYVAESRGDHRPYFSYEWRYEDVDNFLSELLKDTSVTYTISPYTWYEEMFKDIKDTDIIGVKDSFDLFDHLPNLVIKKEEVSPLHSSDFLKALRLAEQSSQCKMIQVGAVLLRAGHIVAIGANDMEGNCTISCPKYPEYNALKEAADNSEDRSVYMQSCTSKCTAIHAEASVLHLALPGDDLLVTYSPCAKCAKQIVERGIRRVVYLKPYHRLEGLTYLDEEGVSHRLAGLNKQE